ncbi:MAG TPA: DUF1003 domain-containing protein, partial [Ktedonobacteraceae bacterium]|nr:DUF1003 domain-containing protein [Ktedonobacteraceae bacterium]
RSTNLGGNTMTRHHIHLPRNIGDSLSDIIATGMGSWKFIIGQTILVIVWMTLNLVGWSRHWDAYPFILLNLLFSTQAAYASPVILMSQNRQSEKDRKRDDLEAAEVEEIRDINKRQLEILELLHIHISGNK